MRGAWSPLLVSPRVAEERCHAAHRRRNRLGCQVCSEVCSEQLAGGQAAKVADGPFESGLGVGAANECRDRRCLLLLSTTPPQATEATVEPAAVAPRGNSRTQEPHGARREGGLHVGEVDEAGGGGEACRDDADVAHAQNKGNNAREQPQPL